jgi:hypothetical protein
MSPTELIDQYAEGPPALREAVRGLTHEQLVARPVPGKWSTLEVVCHLADFEIVYADRLKRVIAEDNPTMFGGDPDVFASRLAYGSRELAEELNVIGATRAQVTRILRTLSESDFERRGTHSEAGPLTLRELVERVTGHVGHHLKFIHEKRQALGA